MGAVWMLTRVELRRRWRSVVVLTLLVGVIGAVVLALAAGARRTDSSLERFEDTSRAATMEISVGDATAAQIEQVRRTPGVRAVAELYQLTMLAPGGRFLPTAGQVDTRFGREVDRARVVAGRAADPTKVDELTIGEALAQHVGIKVGARLRFRSYSPAELKSLDATNDYDPQGPRVLLRVVGIVRRPLDLGGRGAAGGVIVPTPAFVTKYRESIGSYSGSILRVRTEHGAADIPRISRAAKRIFGGSDQISETSLSVEGQGAQNAIDVTTVALWVAALVALVAGLVGMGIAVSREVALVDADQLALGALGARPRQRVAAAAAVGVPIGIGGSLLALAGAVVGSAAFPIGVAAEAEPDPGIRVDGPVLVAGAIVLLLVVVGIAWFAAMRALHGTVRVGERPGIVARAVSDLGLQPPVAVGTQFALDRGRSRRALPVRSSLFGAAFGVLVVVAVLVFAGGIDRLVSTPAAYGWTWDLNAFDSQATSTGDNCSPVQTRLTRVEGLAAVASICTSQVQIHGRPVTGVGFRSLRGRIVPTATEGRTPATPQEVALGADTLAAAGRQVGDRVRISGAAGTHRYLIVGRTVLPSLDDPQPLADGAVFTAAGLERLGESEGGSSIVVRLAPGADRDEVAHQLRVISGPNGVPRAAVLPAEIDRVRQIDGLPVALAAFVGVIALIAVGFALVTTVRSRRRELAVLKTLGFSRRHVRAVVAWHATTVAIVGLGVGIPLGLIVGRFAWVSLADELGVAGAPTWPLVGVLALVPLTVILVNLLAGLPARTAARTRPAVVLRSE